MLTRTFLAATALLLTLTVPVSHANAEEYTWEKNPRWQTNMDKFAAEDAKTSPPDNLILFTGSSSIVRWDLKKHFPDLPVLNRGFGGSRYTDLIDYFDQAIGKYDPETIVLYSGDNDISGGHTTTTVLNNVKRLIKMIHDKDPEIRIIMIPPKASISRWAIFPKMREVGEGQKAIADAHDNIFYVDTSEGMLNEDGKPRPELFIADKLHLTEEAYDEWTKQLRPYLVEENPEQ